MGGVTYGGGRQAPLEATVRIVASQGLRGLTYRSVAAEAGVTHGAVRYHFGDWNRLVEEALEYCVERGVTEIALTSEDSGFDSFAAGLVSMVAGNPSAQAFQYEVSLEARRRPELLRLTERANDTYRASVRTELALRGLHDPDLAEMVFVVLDGLVFHQTVSGETERTERAIKALRSILRSCASQQGTSFGN